MCINGMAGDFACNGFDLAKRVPLEDFGAVGGNDLWGWTDPLDGTEYAIMGMTDRTGFVRLSDPQNPVVVGIVPTQTRASAWRDMKVHDNHVFIVADASGAHGMQVFDLTRLRDSNTATQFTPDFVYSGVENSHNIVVNEDSGFAYIVGTNTCDEGLHMLDVSAPKSPVFVGCHEASGETHDAQCVNYDGPDADYSGQEICFGSNEDHVAIINVTDKSNPQEISRLIYPSLGFVHQNWLDDSQGFLLVGDEADETTFRTRTRTIILDVRDLDNPSYLYTYEANTNAIDHNLYLRGNVVYEANYHAGLRVIEFSGLATNTLQETQFFDTFPDDDETGFEGAWSVYPFFESGLITVSDTELGLFILTPQN